METEPIQLYANAIEQLKHYFDVPFDFYFKLLTDCFWRINESEDLSVLSYWKENMDAVSAAVVKKDGKSFIVSKGCYTLVVAIDCVKIGFVLQNDLQVS